MDNGRHTQHSADDAATSAGDSAGANQRELSAIAAELGIPGADLGILSAAATEHSCDEEVGRQDAFDIGVGEAKARTITVPGIPNPVVTVLIETPLAHLQRPFDYLLNEKTKDAAVGCLVEVRLGSNTEKAWVIDRKGSTEVRGALQPVRRLVSPLPALSPDILQLATTLGAAHGVGASDIIRLAIPPRHARAEKAVLAQYEPPPGRPWGSPAVETAPAPSDPTDGEEVSGAIDEDPPISAELAFSWSAYEAGPALLRHLASGRAPSCLWTPPGGWAGDNIPRYLREMIALAMATLAGGRRVIIAVPTARHMAATRSAFAHFAPQVALACLHSEGSAEERYDAFVRARLGLAEVVIGTRAALYAPLDNLGAIIIWDEANESYREPRSPGASVIEVANARASFTGGTGPAAVILGGFIHSTAAFWLTRAEAPPVAPWPHVQPIRTESRRARPLIHINNEEDASRDGPAGFGRIPARAHAIIRRGLEKGPVLIQVPRSGYINLLACARCREIARCPGCGGTMRLQPVRHSGTLTRTPTPQCPWCGEIPPGFHCPACGGEELRYAQIGSERTAEELGRSFTGVPVLSSGARANAGVVATVDEKPRLVIATPGAEPWPTHGYQAAVILDVAVGAAIPGLDGLIEAARRWAVPIALTVEHRAGGQVFFARSMPEVIAAALVRGDSLAIAHAEIPDRVLLRFPPVTPLALIEGEREAVRTFASYVRQVRPIETVGPIAIDESERSDNVRLLARIPRAEKLPADTAQGELARALRAARIRRSVAKIPGNLRIRLNPGDLLT